MSVDANALERETLERKDREELAKIVDALGGKATTRTRKADLIDQILELTGVTAGDGGAGSDDGAGETKASTEEDDSSGAGRSSATSKSGSDDADGSAKGSGSQSKGSQDKGADKSSQDKGSQDKGSDKGSQGREAGGANGSATSGSTDSDDDAKSAEGSGDDNGDDGEGGGKRRRRRGRNRDGGGQPEEFTGEPIPVEGVLDLRDDGYGFLRVGGLLPSKEDCYVSVKQVRQFGLRKGDLIAGGSRPAFRNEKNPAILRIDRVNGVELEPGAERVRFEEMAVAFATEQLVLSQADEPDELTSRAIDLLAPIGMGSRVLVLAPPRSGKTTLLQTIARSVEANDPEVDLVVVLLDERPEEITEMGTVVESGVVHGSAFDAPSDEHVAVLELALARAERMAEGGADVVVLVDGLTRLARAAHAASQGVGRSLGGLDVGAIHAAKRCFGAGRNLQDAGSVTVVATASVDTNAPADDAVVDALMGAATTHIRLDGFAAARRAFPALDLAGTGTRREELLVGDDGAEQREALRRSLVELPADDSSDQADPLDRLLRRLRDTGSNEELLAAVADESGKG